MRAVLQRVSSASVTVVSGPGSRRPRGSLGVEGRVVGAIDRGLLVLLGVERGDGPSDRDYVVSKTLELRIFPDADGRMNKSVSESGGSLLIVSQFTLCGDARKGRRPSFDDAAGPAEAKLLYEDVVRELRSANVPVATGEFQAMMHVALVNDGPVTILLDSRRRF